MKLINLTIALFINCYAFSQTINLTLDLPDFMEAGEKTLIKGTIEYDLNPGFFRYNEKVPEGFVAYENENKGGKFEQKKNQIRILWMTAPDKNNTSFSYYLEVPKASPDSLIFNGSVHCIRNNSVETFSATPKVIYIRNNEPVANNQTVKAQEIKCIRKKPLMDSNNDIVIGLEVFAGDIIGFIKIKEEIPKGYKAISIDTHDGIFTFKDNLITFMWMSAPYESVFEVTYKLIPDESMDIEDLNISGEFVYSESGMQKSVPIVQKE